MHLQLLCLGDLENILKETTIAIIFVFQMDHNWQVDGEIHEKGENMLNSHFIMFNLLMMNCNFF